MTEEEVLLAEKNPFAADLIKRLLISLAVILVFCVALFFEVIKTDDASLLSSLMTGFIACYLVNTLRGFLGFRKAKKLIIRSRELKASGVIKVDEEKEETVENES